jgi:hypothetical protein
MIVRLERARTWLSRFIVSLVLIAALSQDAVFDLVQHIVPKGDDGFYQALYILVLILVYGALEGLTGLAIDKSRLVRKLIMGHEDIEGYWLEVIYQSDEIIAGALVLVRHEDRRYILDGRDFTDDGALRSWFTSELSQFSEIKYNYTYEATRPKPARDVTGHGIKRFSGNGRKRLVQYEGFYFEARNPRRFYVHGERLADFIKSQKMRFDEAVKPNNIPLLVHTFVENRRAALPLASKPNTPPEAPLTPDAPTKIGY